MQLFKTIKTKILKLWYPEEWNPIKNYEGRYEISNYGRVKSLSKQWKLHHGGLCKRKEKILSQKINSVGYPAIDLSKQCKRKSFNIYHLVWDHFGNAKRNGYKLQVDHKDENKLNSQIDNLQLLTQRENTVKYYRTKKTTSNYDGISFYKRYDKFVARITLNKKRILLGYFKSEIDAANEYQRALKEFNKTGEITVYSPIVKRKTSKYKGIGLNKKNNRWRCRIRINQKEVSLGYFDNEFMAHLAYEKALKQINGGV